MTQPLLQIEGLTAWYGRVQALYGVSLRVEQGGVTALLGANGAGKTTTLRAICGMVRRSGLIRIDGRDVGTMRTEHVARLGVGHVPEGRGTFVQLSVEDNLRLGAILRSARGEIEADLERIFQYFPRLKERIAQPAGTLSGGEQQMLAVSRALMSKPKLLLLDEPSFGLSPRLVSEVFGMLAAVRDRERLGILLVEQNAHLALDLADRAVLLETGRTVLTGTADELRESEIVQRAYLGY